MQASCKTKYLVQKNVPNIRMRHASQLLIDFWPTVFGRAFVTACRLSVCRLSRPVSHSYFSPTPANSVLSRRQPTHIG